MHDYQLLHNTLIASALLFSLGAIGFACRRNLVIVLLSAGIMFQAVIVALAAYGHFFRDGSGEAFSLYVVAMLAILGSIGAGMAALVARHRNSLDLAGWRRIGRADADRQFAEPTSLPANPQGSVNAAESGDSGTRRALPGGRSNDANPSTGGTHG